MVMLCVVPLGWAASPDADAVKAIRDALARRPPQCARPQKTCGCSGPGDCTCGPDCQCAAGFARTSGRC
jgi:hypothetical protein